MDESDSKSDLKPVNEGLETKGVASSLELGKVKEVLAVRLHQPAEHYTSLELVGKGSFGEVHKAHDTLLGRDVAIKSLKPQYRDHEKVVDRFLKEARGTAQLEHPNIMPVHEMGVTDDLGIYFTMKKIEGEDLKQVLDHLEAGTSFYRKKYPLNVLLEIFLAVCNGVAFAHSRGVIHRDLKPANIMIGEYGEVLILDWGLVKQLSVAEEPHKGVQLKMDEFDVGSKTLDGAISGTPNYMSPEQAEGHADEVDFQSDIYSLGAILYHILTYLPPFEKTQLRQLLDNVKAGTFDPPRKRRPDLKIPRELEAICMRAMARFQVNRYRSVEKMAEDIRNYIGHRDVSAYKAPRHVRLWKKCRRNPVKASVAAAVMVAFGLAYTIQFAMVSGHYSRSLDHAEVLRAELDNEVVLAKSIHDALQQEQSGLVLHEKSEREKALEAELAEATRKIDRLSNLAIGYYEGVPPRYRASRPVLAGYADVVWQQIEYALYRGDYGLAQQWVDTVKQRYEVWGRAFGEEAQAYLAAVQQRIDGYGSLVVNESPHVREVIVWPYVEDGPRLVQGDAVGRTRSFPLSIPKIKQGSYLIWATHENGSFIPYPVYIDHGEHLELRLVIPESIPDGMVYVPPGPFIHGGEESRFFRRHTLDLPAFFIKKTEVTVAEYLEFWKELASPQLREDYMSRIRFRESERRYRDAWDADGNLLDERLSLDYPVVGITLDAANAFCVWKSRRLNETIRLPTAEEWEKAARGVDGRIYVWGNGFEKDQNLTLTKYNDEGKAHFPLWAPPGKFKRDVSVYNAYDMAGNVREMTASLLPNSEEFYQLKGGSASTPQNFLPCSYSSDTAVVPSDVGFRYIMEIETK